MQQLHGFEGGTVHYNCTTTADRSAVKSFQGICLDFGDDDRVQCWWNSTNKVLCLLRESGVPYEICTSKMNGTRAIPQGMEISINGITMSMNGTRLVCLEIYFGGGDVHVDHQIIGEKYLIVKEAPPHSSEKPVVTSNFTDVTTNNVTVPTSSTTPTNSGEEEEESKKDSDSPPTGLIVGLIVIFAIIIIAAPIIVYKKRDLIMAKVSKVRNVCCPQQLAPQQFALQQFTLQQQHPSQQGGGIEQNGEQVPLQEQNGNMKAV